MVWDLRLGPCKRKLDAQNQFEFRDFDSAQEVSALYRREKPKVFGSWWPPTAFIDVNLDAEQGWKGFSYIYIYAYTEPFFDDHFSVHWDIMVFSRRQPVCVDFFGF